jgi:hypothetical protein
MKKEIHLQQNKLRTKHEEIEWKNSLKILTTMKKEYYMLKRTKKKEHQMKIIEQLLKSSDSKQFWGAVKKFRGKKRIPSTITRNEWHHFYSDLFKKDNKYNDNGNEEIYHNTTTSGLDSPITSEELRNATKKLSQNKAPGHDGIPNEIWKIISLKHSNILLQIFNNALETGTCPSSWSEIVVCPIHKKGDQSQPVNFRPISLVPTILKLLTTILTTRLQDWCDEHKKISECQAGFRRGMGTLEQIFTFNTIVQSKLKSSNGKLFVTFVDLKQCFDSVDHRLLWKSLEEKELGSGYIKLFRNIYNNAKGKVRSDTGYTKHFDIQRGVLQGESASSVLFILFLDQVVEELRKSSIPTVDIGSAKVNILLFADDQVLLANNATQLQQKNDLLAQLLKTLHLQANISKTKVMIFRKPQTRINNYNFTWNGEELEIVDNYTYLGTPYQSNGTFKLASKTFMNKTIAATAQVWSICKRSRVPPIATHTKLFNSLAKTVLLYASPVWALDHVEELEKIPIRFFKRLMRLPPSTPDYAVRLEFGLEKIKPQIVKQTLQFIKKLLVREESSLLGQCLRYQLRWGNREGTNKKYNWFNKVQNLLANTNITLTGTPKEILQLIIVNQTQAVEDCRQHGINMDTERLMNTSRIPRYAAMKSHALPEFYLNLKLPYAICSLIVQLRIGLFSIKLGDQRIIITTKCPLCTSHSDATVDHLTLHCKILQPHRNNHLKQYNNNYTYFFELYNNNKDDRNFFKALFCFWIDIFKFYDLLL